MSEMKKIGPGKDTTAIEKGLGTDSLCGKYNDWGSRGESHGLGRDLVLMAMCVDSQEWWEC